MNRKEKTWFGIKLTQKQATNLFVLSIIGTLITFLVFIQIFIPLFIMYASPYSYGDLSYFFQSLLFMSPYLIGLSVGLILSVYTLFKSRKIAKSYSEFISTNISKQASTLFCPNCGNKRIAEEIFCSQCGQEFR